jgi:hypothetical protein
MSPCDDVALLFVALSVQIDNPLLRGVAKAVAVYRAALRPRLLVLVGLAALVGVYGKVRQQQQTPWGSLVGTAAAGVHAVLMCFIVEAVTGGGYHTAQEHCLYPDRHACAALLLCVRPPPSPRKRGITLRRAIARGSLFERTAGMMLRVLCTQPWGVYVRLLVLQVVGEPLPLVYTGCLLGGFLTYKGALLARLVEELTPKVGLPLLPSRAQPGFRSGGAGAAWCGGCATGAGGLLQSGKH